MSKTPLKPKIVIAILLCLTLPKILQAKPPNVLLIISDDQGWSDYSFMGHPVIKTPHIDRLASQSLVFTRGYVPSSLCRPSLATLATGLFPHQPNI
ncbi:MAG: sulfatase-like hydrolase/transferase, partial [Planctomycetes bacterium]|nr:sulfatase-like hydrolase/transferase [Planctomycetota bacterium]